MSLETIRKNRGAQVVIGLMVGIAFGFLLQKGGVTDYNVITGQLLLTDFTVLKVMLSAVIVGMAGFHILRHFGYVNSRAPEGTLGANVIGGLIFGAGFALLGYCPGTVAGAVGTGALDALFGGVVGLLIGSGIFVEIFPKLNAGILNRGPFPVVTVPEFLKMRTWSAILLLEIVMIGVLLFLGYLGF